MSLVNLWKKLSIHFLEILALSSFALAQPLFDLLSKNVEFLVVRRSQPLDIFLFILFLCLALPAALMLLEILVGLVSQKALSWVHAILLAALVAITFLPVLKRLGSLPGTVWLTLALVLGLRVFFFLLALQENAVSLALAVAGGAPFPSTLRF